MHFDLFLKKDIFMKSNSSTYAEFLNIYANK